jgi:hypothetical protein
MKNAVLAIMCVAVMLAACNKNQENKIVGQNKERAPTPQSAAAVINAKFERVGDFGGNNSGGLRGLTYYVTNPNRQDIEAFCKEMTSSVGSGRILKIHFFDDRANTPDVTLNYYFPESSDPYLIADYFHNPFNGQQGLKVHKDMPYQPTARRQ